MNFRLDVRGEAVALTVAPRENGGFEVTTPQQRHAVTCRRIDAHHLFLTVDGEGVNVFVSGDADTKRIVIQGAAYTVVDADARPRSSASGTAAGNLPGDVTPPMPAVVVKILVAGGQQVRRGDKLVVVSAMKMETTLTAPFDARVVRINAAVGDKVKPGDILVDLEARESATTANAPRATRREDAPNNGRPT